MYLCCLNPIDSVDCIKLWYFIDVGLASLFCDSLNSLFERYNISYSVHLYFVRGESDEG